MEGMCRAAVHPVPVPALEHVPRYFASCYMRIIEERARAGRRSNHQRISALFVQKFRIRPYISAKYLSRNAAALGRGSDTIHHCQRAR